ncbi:MAG TPA: aminotransferase class V-fold PLP-dependent enzyme [Pyrinomonadaceae bacterium]|jgi:aromatic-L-amino-acid decarboxylase
MKESLSAEHERLGRAVTKLISDYTRSLDQRPVTSRATPAELEKLFDEPLPLAGMETEALLERVRRDVIPHAMQIPSPRYYGLFNPTPLPIGVWADALAAALNQNLAAWRNSPSASMIEARVLRWLCELTGYESSESFGTLTSGGSEANLIALKCARDKWATGARDEGLLAAGRELVVYASEQCHYSFEKSVDILGLGRKSLRKIATDDNFQIRTDALRSKIEADLAAGRTPCSIAGAAGATSTGVIDPLDQLAEIAREYGCWFHVDAAYGGALSFSEKYRGLLKGIERADSVTIDPHKWMFVPFACGAVLVREGASVLRDAFDITPEYLSEQRTHMAGTDATYDFFRYGQLGTRRFNALKIWMALKLLGQRGYAEIIERQIELTNYLAARLDELKDFRRLGLVQTAVCCFRFEPAESSLLDGPALDRLQTALQQRVELSGEAWLSSTVLHGRRALRVNINSFLTEQRHIDDLLELLRRESQSLIESGEFK